MFRIITIVIGHVASYATTLNFAVYLIRPQDGPGWAGAVAAALAAEALVYAMKEMLWSNGLADPMGWAGIILDGVVNTGGILPWAPRILTFGPISLSLGLIAVNVADPVTATVGAAAISVILGFVLSILPHWMRHVGKARQK